MFYIYQQFSPSPIGTQISDSFASSASSCALASNLKSASRAMSVFHSFNPPKSFSPAFKLIFSEVEMASALVAAINIAIELFLALEIEILLLTS